MIEGRDGLYLPTLERRGCLTLLSPNRSVGLQLIIGYKLTKIPFVVALALWLTLARSSALVSLERLATDLGELGSVGSRLARWMDSHLDRRVLSEGAAVAWLDSLTTAAEVILLLRGKAWGEWLVAAGLGALVVVEVVSLERRPSLTRLVVLIVNAAVVAYLVARRSREVKRRTPRRKRRARDDV